MASYEVKQGKDIKNQDPAAPLEPVKYYVVDVDTGEVKAGPYDTKEEAEAKRRALMAPKNK